MARVDYERYAAEFRRGRTLPVETLEAWRRAVAPFVSPERGPRVLDLGSGTGQFTTAFVSWFDAYVVGLEPAAAMRAEAAARGPARRVSYVGGAGEAIPLHASTFDVAWLSTVVHHLADVAACAAELRRVLLPGGSVLVRGYFPDRGPPLGLLGYFPGIERAAATFPTAAWVAEAFAPAGFRLAGMESVAEPVTGSVDSWLAHLHALRHADSMLRGLTDDEFAAGLAAIESKAGAVTDLATRLDLVVLR